MSGAGDAMRDLLVRPRRIAWCMAPLVNKNLMTIAEVETMFAVHVDRLAPEVRSPARVRLGQALRDAMVADIRGRVACYDAIDRALRPLLALRAPFAELLETALACVPVPPLRMDGLAVPGPLLDRAEVTRTVEVACMAALQALGDANRRAWSAQRRRQRRRAA